MNANIRKALLVGSTIGFVAVSYAQTFAASLVDVVNKTASGAIATSGEVTDGPAGTIVYTIMGIQLVITVVSYRHT